MNRTSLKWWQLAIMVNALIAFFAVMGINEFNYGAFGVIVYAIVSFCLTRFVSLSKVKGYDDVA